WLKDLTKTRRASRELGDNWAQSGETVDAVVSDGDAHPVRRADSIRHVHSQRRMVPGDRANLLPLKSVSDGSPVRSNRFVRTLGYGAPTSEDQLVRRCVEICRYAKRRAQVRGESVGLSVLDDRQAQQIAQQQGDAMWAPSRPKTEIRTCQKP